MRFLISMFFVATTLAAQTVPHTLLLNGQYLAAAKKTKNAALMAEVEKSANKAMHAGPYSVMESKRIPPSGDRHDYMSMGPYWWPNPKTKNGLPYVRRDGQHDPLIDQIPNHANLLHLDDAVEALGIGYYMTGNEAFARHAVLLVRTWFLNPATRMNPNMNYAQGIPGITNGRAEGVLEMRYLPNLLDGVTLLQGAKSLTPKDLQGLELWLKQYLHWLRTNKLALREEHARNNHGSWYAEQAAGIALYLGDTPLAREVADSTKARIAWQIKPDGSQPLELVRTKSFSYSAFNLTALSMLAEEARLADVDLWNDRSPDGGSLRAALNYMLPYALREKQWEHKSINGIQPGGLELPLLYAAIRYRDARYLALAKQFDKHPTVEIRLLTAEAENAMK